MGPSKVKQPFLVRFLRPGCVTKMSLKILIFVVYNMRNWKQSRCPSNTLLYKCLMEYYAAIKREQFWLVL